MENKTRVFGRKDDEKFWSDKPIQKGHPKFKEKQKWYHVHIYNIPCNPTHISPCGEFRDTMKSVKLHKCRCGKVGRRLFIY